MTRPRFHQPTVSGALVEIADAGHALVVAPHFGGRIVSFRRDGRDILRPTPERDIAEPRVYGFAGFPLMPYSGPLFGPGFSFSGTDHELRRNVREEPTATHGEAWIASFTIEHRSARSLRLVHDHSPEDGVFPFAWRGVLDYALTGEGLEIDLRVTSRDHRPMPAGHRLPSLFPEAARNQAALRRGRPLAARCAGSGEARLRADRRGSRLHAGSRRLGDRPRPPL